MSISFPFVINASKTRLYSVFASVAAVSNFSVARFAWDVFFFFVQSANPVLVWEFTCRFTGSFFVAALVLPAFNADQSGCILRFGWYDTTAFLCAKFKMQIFYFCQDGAMRRERSLRGFQLAVSYTPRHLMPSSFYFCSCHRSKCNELRAEAWRRLHVRWGLVVAGVGQGSVTLPVGCLGASGLVHFHACWPLKSNFMKTFCGRYLWSVNCATGMFCAVAKIIAGLPLTVKRESII